MGTLAAISGIMHFAGPLTLFDIALKTWDWAAIIYPLCAISSVIWNMVHYDRKDSAAIAKAMGGFESNDPALRDMVGAVHTRSGLGGEVPRVYIIPSDEPNAFAAGTKASVVAVTTGLLDLLTPRELRAVLAHEIGHVRNRDMARSLGAGCMVAGLGFAMTIGDYLLQSDRHEGRRRPWLARAHLVRLRGDHASHGYHPENDALAFSRIRGRRVREEHRRGSRPRVGAGETGGVPLKGYKARREDARPRVERVRGVVY